ncbi:uncharacterized protein [Dermacentor albipictus]|uniref:uncharacterized protein n=1 Tax=Dermacentor albipictus TaxID=60249 RepID=UPI0038FD3BB3
MVSDEVVEFVYWLKARFLQSTTPSPSPATLTCKPHHHQLHVRALLRRVPTFRNSEAALPVAAAIKPSRHQRIATRAAAKVKSASFNRLLFVCRLQQSTIPSPLPASLTCKPHDHQLRVRALQLRVPTFRNSEAALPVAAAIKPSRHQRIATRAAATAKSASFNRLLFVCSAEPSSATVDVTWMKQLDCQAIVTSATDSRNIKPTMHSATVSGAGSVAVEMVHSQVWLVLQIVPLIVSSAEPSSATVDVTWMSQLDRQAAVTSPTDSRHMKTTLHSATFSGGGNTAITMILPLIVGSAEASSATVDVTWMSQLDCQAIVTSATDSRHIKPTMHSATVSEGGSMAAEMVHSQAWLVLQ